MRARQLPDPYRDTGAIFFLDAHRTELLTVAGTVTAARDAAGGSTVLTGSGLTVDATGQENGRSGLLLSNADGSQSLKTTSVGPTGTTSYTLSVAAEILANPASFGALAMIGRIDDEGTVIGINSTGKLWVGNFIIGVQALYDLSDSKVIATVTCDGSNTRIYLDGVLRDTLGAWSIKQGFGIFPGATAVAPPTARVRRLGVWATDIGRNGATRIARADTIALNRYQPTRWTAQGDSITAEFGLNPGEGWVAQALALMNAGRYEPIEVSNIAQSGRLADGYDTAPEIAARCARRRREPYTLSLGCNDLTFDMRTAETVIASIKAIADSVYAAGYAPIITTVLNYAGSDSRLPAVNSWIENSSGYPSIPLASLPHAQDTTDATYFQEAPLGRHPTATLQAEMGTLAATYLRRYMA